MMGASSWIHLDIASVKNETDRAFLVVLDDGEEVWLPKSQISDPDDYEAGDENVTMSITEWIANEKGLA